MGHSTDLSILQLKPWREPQSRHVITQLVHFSRGLACIRMSGEYFRSSLSRHRGTVWPDAVLWCRTSTAILQLKSWCEPQSRHVITQLVHFRVGLHAFA